MEHRHETKVAAARSHAYSLLLIGDSITQNLEKQEYQSVWNRYYGSRDALDLGYSGGRTENTLWNLSHGELDGQTPKAAILLIGTNNCDDANYRVVDSAEDIVAGTRAIVALLRERLPGTKLIVLRILPRQNVYHQPDGTERGSMSRRFATNQRAGELLRSIADDKNVYYLDLNHLFLRLDGTIDPVLMPDLLHPSPEGATLMADAIEPVLSSILGDSSRAPAITNNALVPVPKLENDFYDWWQRHAAIVEMASRRNPEIILVGDSITHLWGGEPTWIGRPPGGAKAFKATFGEHNVLNLGFGFDRIQNVLWRLDNGEFDGVHPKLVVVNIGTNNLVATPHARANTPAEIAAGIREVLLRIRAKSPDSKIVLMGLFPRGSALNNPLRASAAAVNHLLQEETAGTGISFIDLTPQFLSPDGSISKEVMSDYLHPTEAGYAIWGHALKPEIEAIK